MGHGVEGWTWSMEEEHRSEAWRWSIEVEHEVELGDGTWKRGMGVGHGGRAYDGGGAWRWSIEVGHGGGA